jgi:hypothetical protein
MQWLKQFFFIHTTNTVFFIFYHFFKFEINFSYATAKTKLLHNLKRYLKPNAFMLLHS